MVEEHWFDTLNKDLVRHTPRREFLRWVSALGLGTLFAGGASVAEAKKKGRKRKESKPKPCMTAQCKFFFPNESEARNCQNKCLRCKKAGTTFCIHRPDNAHNALHATCCHKDEQCCEVSQYCCPKGYNCCADPNKPFPCCPPGAECCRSDPDGCCPTGAECCGDMGGCCPQRSQCCPTAPERCCPDDTDCCPDGCIDTRSDRNNCGRCGQECPDGWECCGGSCRDVSSNRNHCGACNNVCADGLACCNGACVDQRNDINNCGRCGRVCDAGHGCCARFCYDPGQATCCGDDRGACGGAFVCCPPDSETVCCPGPEE